MSDQTQLTVSSGSRCTYCKRPFEKGEKVWHCDRVGIICAPASHSECGATHVDPFRIPTEEWSVGIAE